MLGWLLIGFDYLGIVLLMVGWLCVLVVYSVVVIVLFVLVLLVGWCVRYCFSGGWGW